MAHPELERSQFPFFPFFVDAWLSSAAIESFTLEQEGAYLRLLLRQWTAPDGYLPKDEATLAQLSRLGARWRKVGRPILRKCFVKRAGGYLNLRLRRHWEEVRDKSAQAKRAAAFRWNGKNGGLGE